jgi:hypothetical protein
MSTAKWNLAGAALLFFGASLVNAQTAFDVNVGFGSAWDSANSGGIDNASSLNAFGACTPNSGDANCESLPALNGFFLGFGGDLMLFKHFGVGVQASLQPSRETYGPLSSRQTFYDVNGIYAPITTKRDPCNWRPASAARAPASLIPRVVAWERRFAPLPRSRSVTRIISTSMWEWAYRSS